MMVFMYISLFSASPFCRAAATATAENLEIQKCIYIWVHKYKMHWDWSAAVICGKTSFLHFPLGAAGCN